jgi:hypothetical protein
MGAREPATDEFVFPLTGGSFDPVSDALSARGRGVIALRQRIMVDELVVGSAEVTLAEPSLQLPSTLEVEATGNSDSVPFMSFALSSIGFGELAGAAGALTVDPTGRALGLHETTVTVSAAGARTLNGFRQLYEDRRGGDKQQDTVNAGETLGTVFLSAQAE